MSKKWKTIYLDWDGVLWDFKQAFCDWIGREAPESNKWEFYTALGMSESMFQGCLEGLPKDFWGQKKYILPHARKLVEWAKANADRVAILTVAPERGCVQGKTALAGSIFGLGLYAVDGAGDKIRYAKEGCLLIDDKASSVVRFVQTNTLASGFVWPAEYNTDLHSSWYFDTSELNDIEDIKKKAHWALTDADRSALLKDLKAEKAEKPALDYGAMDEAKRRKMTPMYSGLLAYFPDALAQVAQNSMVGHYQHNDPSDPMYWDRSKSADEMDAMIRHMADHSKDPYDSDGRLHMSKVAWRALAFVQKFIEEEQNNG